MPRPRKNIADVQALTARFEAGRLTGPEFSAAVRALPDSIERSYDPTYQPTTRFEDDPQPFTRAHRPPGARREIILATLQGRSPTTATRLTHLLNMHESNVYPCLADLVRDGLVVRSGAGGYRDPYRFALRHVAPARAA